MHRLYFTCGREPRFPFLRELEVPVFPAIMQVRKDKAHFGLEAVTQHVGIMYPAPAKATDQHVMRSLSDWEGCTGKK